MMGNLYFKYIPPVCILSLLHAMIEIVYIFQTKSNSNTLTHNTIQEEAESVGQDNADVSQTDGDEQSGEKPSTYSKE